MTENGGLAVLAWRYLATQGVSSLGTRNPVERAAGSLRRKYQAEQRAAGGEYAYSLCLTVAQCALLIFWITVITAEAVTDLVFRMVTSIALTYEWCRGETIGAKWRFSRRITRMVAAGHLDTALRCALKTQVVEDQIEYDDLDY